MCIAGWTTSSDEYALILATNRDEFLERPTLPAAFHNFGDETAPNSVLSGLDLQAGGTWMGMNLRGEIALLTNITEDVPDRSIYKSRGELPKQFLTRASSEDHEAFVLRLEQSQDKYAGFNLVLFSPKRNTQGLGYDYTVITNNTAGGAITRRPHYASNILATSNGPITDQLPGKDRWPKVLAIESQFDSLTKTNHPQTDSDLVSSLHAILRWKPDRAITTRADLRHTIFINPIPVGQHGSFYGTRLHTVVLVKKNGEAFFSEREVYKLNEGVISETNDVDARREFIFRISV